MAFSASVQVVPDILTINGGSSSIRFALFGADERLGRRMAGKIERLGTDAATLSAEVGGTPVAPVAVKAHRPAEAAAALVDWLARQMVDSPVAVGHRIVQGLGHRQPQRASTDLLGSLRALIPFDPEHLPYELELIDAFAAHYPRAHQVVCFDTEFHQTLPRVAYQLPLPRRFEAKGLRRYGFHGLSYTYLLEQLRLLGEPAAISGRVILAHLGGGASLAAVLDGSCIDTSMGFSPAAGLMMSTRCGDLDPGVIDYLARVESLSVSEICSLLNHESGLKGVSAASGDIRDLLQREASDVRAHEAVELFCHLARRQMGAHAASLGGLDALVFAGGIGENSAEIRARLCARMQYLGIEIDAARNAISAPLISKDSSTVRVRVIKTDEELIIARKTQQLLNASSTEGVS
jgi:acetate kinase